MARHVTKLLWATLFFLGSTMIFWGMLQQTQYSEAEYPWHKTKMNHKYTTRMNTSRHASMLRLTIQDQGSRYYRLIDGNYTHIVAISDFEPVLDGTPSYLRSPKSNRLWPHHGDRDDRILAQINHVPKNPRLESPEEEKLILIYDGYPEGIPNGNKKFLSDGCPVRNCRMTEDRMMINKSHAVVFQSGMYSMPSIYKPHGQIWIMYVLESPDNFMDVSISYDLFNWTATYRLDSTINTPYERFVPYKNASKTPTVPTRNYAEGKTKKIAWFVSNCYTINGRLEYAKRLQKYIEVDIYGDCGTYKCYRQERSKCNQMLNKHYKFYLAFENSNCRDYITEKFYWNGLQNDVIPIVMGARPDDYAAVAPPHSYIHVDDFSSPAELADYLYLLDKNDTLYNSYFAWKGTGQFIDTKFWCRLCSMVQEATNSAAPPRDKFSMWYQDIQTWFHGPGVCIRPNPEEGQIWASWRNVTKDGLAYRPQTLRYGPRTES